MARRNLVSPLVGLPHVRDFMDTRVPALRPHMDILQAIDFLLENHVTGAPVVDELGGVIGILTEKDCLKLLARGVDAAVPRGTVEAFMDKDVKVISPDTDIYFAAGLFLANHFRRLPVVENGRLVGAVTRLDILRVIRANLHWAPQDS